MVSSRLVGVLVIVVIVFLASVVATLLYGDTLIPLFNGERYLVRMYTRYTYNLSSPNTSLSLSMVNAIVWDFRGIDTFYETLVFFTAVIASTAIYYEYLGEAVYYRRKLSPIPRTIHKLVIPIGLALGLGLAIKGLISPGGGFQGGVLGAVGFYILCFSYSLNWVIRRGLGYRVLALTRISSLILMILAIVSPVVIGWVAGLKTYVFQVSVRDNVYIGTLIYYNGYPLSMFILLFNLLEFAAVFSGSIVLLYIMAVGGYREEVRI